jgi:hypothetical protein
MKMSTRRALSGLAAMPLALALTSIAHAQSPAEFY